MPGCGTRISKESFTTEKQKRGVNTEDAAEVQGEFTAEVLGGARPAARLGRKWSRRGCCACPRPAPGEKLGTDPSKSSGLSGPQEKLVALRGVGQAARGFARVFVGYFCGRWQSWLSLRLRCFLCALALVLLALQRGALPTQGSFSNLSGISPPDGTARVFKEEYIGLFRSALSCFYAFCSSLP